MDGSDTATHASTAASNNLNLRHVLAYEAGVVEAESAIRTKSMPKSRRDITLLAIERMRQTAINGYDPAQRKGRFGKELDGLFAIAGRGDELRWRRRLTMRTLTNDPVMRQLYIENLALREALAYEARVIEAQTGLEDGGRLPARRREQITAVVDRMRESAVLGAHPMCREPGGQLALMCAYARLLAKHLTFEVEP